MTDAKDAEILPDDHPLHHANDTGDAAVSRPDEHIPPVLIALPLNQRPVFPTMMLPLVIPSGRLSDAVRHAIAHMDGYVGFFLTKTPLDNGAAYKVDDLYAFGCAARVMKHQEVDGGNLQVFAQVVGRFRFERAEQTDPVVIVRGAAVRIQVDASNPQVRACAMAIVTSLKDLVQHNPVFSDEIKLVLSNFNNIDGPGRLADVAASLTTAKREELQAVLETVPILPRMEKVLVLLAKEAQLTQLKAKITHQIEEKVSENQRKFFLNEQLKAIKEELGVETDEKALDLKRFREVLNTKGPVLTDEVKRVMDEELRKLSLLDPASSEYGVVRARLEWLTDMPWGTYSDDNLDLAALRTGLDKDHFGLDDVKDRIVEFCAVRRLKADRGGGIIALVGPPGTGKTSVGQSIAKNLGRKFFRFSLGGMRDEAEIKGHRRTYIGALPGKLVQALRRSGTMNPVIMLDEIDKLSHGVQGDPASALLEVLDPEQNKDFLDHYLDVRVDLSQVLFVCTGNDLNTIPEPLRDRMEIIRLAGYVEVEKQAIAKDHLVPKQKAAHGLTSADIFFTKTALSTLIRDYAREAGVRHLEQLIATVCRKVATAKARTLDGATDQTAGKTLAEPFARRSIGPSDLTAYLGKPLMRDDELINHPEPGVVTGLAWTSMGGATLEVEAVCVAADKGGLTLSGQLGDVMKESAGLARSYLMSHGDEFGIPASWFEKHQIHLHVPAGATPKDGPSAGITMATALLSLALKRPTKRRLGMTGELTLTGRVYPIGGVREKLVAAKRSGLTRVLLPKANERDYDELPQLVRDGIEVTFVEHLDEVLRHSGLIAMDHPKTGKKPA
ncbi:MAG: endopeptidase La [Planctomycetes bacterium]|nr:endopeptidase La [Planctomycetota bacterium]